MGHIHLGVLPKTKAWRQVLALLDERAAVPEIVQATAIAAEKDFKKAADNPVLVEAVRLLVTITQAASSEDFAKSLRIAGVDTEHQPLLLDLIMSADTRLLSAAWIDRHDDFATLVRRAFSEALTETVGQRLPGLFDVEPADVQDAVASFAKPRAFAVLARTFFERIVSGTLSYYLSRVLSAKIGAGLAFADGAGRTAFDDALTRHCAESSLILKEFAAAWYAKWTAPGEVVTHSRAAAFTAIAFRKVIEELHERQDEYR